MSKFVLVKDNMLSKKDCNNIIDVNYISGSFMFFKRKIFKNIKGFNNKFFMYFEDIEICDVINHNNSKMGILKYLDVIHERSRASYKFNRMFVFHFISWIYYKLYNRSKN